MKVIYVQEARPRAVRPGTWACLLNDVLSSLWDTSKIQIGSPHTVYHPLYRQAILNRFAKKYCYSLGLASGKVRLAQRLNGQSLSERV